MPRPKSDFIDMNAPTGIGVLSETERRLQRERKTAESDDDSQSGKSDEETLQV